MAVAEYHTSTCVESSAGRPSAGAYSEKPVRTAAPFHTGSSSAPSTAISASKWGTRTSTAPAIPE